MIYELISCQRLIFEFKGKILIHRKLNESKTSSTGFLLCVCVCAYIVIKLNKC